MVTFKVAIKKKELRSDGSVNVKIRVTKDRKPRFISTKYYVLPEYFDAENELILPGGGMTKDDADRANNRLRIEIGVLAKKVEQQEDRIRHMDISSLMAILRNKRSKYELLAMMEDRISSYHRLGNLNYADTLLRTKRAVERFAGSVVPFQAINPAWLKRFEVSLRMKGLCSNTIGIHMRDIRTTFNQAITDRMIEPSYYPFREYKIPREATIKRNLSAEEVSAIYRLEIKDPGTCWARDMWMLSFFLMGINMKDMAHLKTIEDGRINYIRSKGKKPYSIRVEPEALEIIHKSHGDKYLLDFVGRYKHYRIGSDFINLKMKDIVKQCGINKPVTTYWARYSWPSIGRRLKIAVDDISKGLGHQRVGKEVTEIYIDEQLEYIDLANRQIIDHIIAVGRKDSPEIMFYI